MLGILYILVSLPIIYTFMFPRLSFSFNEGSVLSSRLLFSNEIFNPQINPESISNMNLSLSSIKSYLQHLGISTVGIFDRYDLENMLKQALQSKQVSSLINQQKIQRQRMILSEQVADEMRNMRNMSDIDVVLELRRRKVDFDPLNNRKQLEYLLANTRVNKVDRPQPSNEKSTYLKPPLWSYTNIIPEEIMIDLEELQNRFINQSVITMNIIKSHPIRQNDNWQQDENSNSNSSSNDDDENTINNYLSIENRDLLKEVNEMISFVQTTTKFPIQNTTFDQSTYDALHHWCSRKLSDQELLALVKLRGLTKESTLHRQALIDLFISSIILEASTVHYRKNNSSNNNSNNHSNDNNASIKSNDKISSDNLHSAHSDIISIPSIDVTKIPNTSKSKVRKSKIKTTQYSALKSQPGPIGIIFSSFAHLIHEIKQKPLFPHFSMVIIQNIISSIENIILTFTRWSCGENQTISSSTVTVLVALLATIIRKGLIGYIGIMLSIRMGRILFTTRSQLNQPIEKDTRLTSKS